MPEKVMDSIDLVCMSIIGARSRRNKVGIAADPPLRRPGDTEAMGRLIARGHAVPLDKCRLEHLREEGRPDLAEIEVLIIKITKPGVDWFYAQQGKTPPGEAPAERRPIGEPHHIVLDIIKRLGGTTYGVPVGREIENRGLGWSYGRMYSLLQDLVARGYLDTWLETVGNDPVRGSKPRRWYRVIEQTEGKVA